MPQDLADRLEEGIFYILDFVPQLALALGILIGGFAIAKMVERGTAAALRRLGFDRWMQEGGVTEALARAGTALDPSGVLAKLVFWAVMLLVILLASDALGLVIVSAIFAELLAYIPLVIAAVIILILGILLGEFVKNLVLASAGAMSGVPTLARAAKAAVILLAIFMALGQLGVAEDIVLVAFIAVVGAAALAAGIAFGLGGRDLAAQLTREWYERSRTPMDAHHHPDEPEEPGPPTERTRPRRQPEQSRPDRTTADRPSEAGPADMRAEPPPADGRPEPPVADAPRPRPRPEAPPESSGAEPPERPGEDR